MSRRVPTVTLPASRSSDRAARSRLERRDSPSGEVIIYRKTKRRDTKKFTYGTTHLQGIVEANARVLVRLSEGAADGLKRYNRAAKRSAKRRRDGALRDVPENLARGFAIAGAEAAKAPEDFIKRVDIRDVWRIGLPIAGSLGRSLGLR